ncbi:MAG: PAS domain S-box protein [Blastocatellales bacterium]
MNKRQLTVLIVDGAPEDRALLRETLWGNRAARYSVIEAETGARAIELRRERSPDCVIVNHDLPDMPGLEAIKRFTAESESLACGMVALIGVGDTRLAVEMMKSGAHDCLEKNRARGEELLRAVSHAIETADERRQAMASMPFGSEMAKEARQAAGVGAGAMRDAPQPAPPSPKQAEEQLRLLKTAIEQSNESVIITTAQLDRPGPQIVYINPAFTKMTGYAPEDVIGKTPRILQGPKTDPAVLDRLREDCARGRIFFGETVNYRKDGSEFFIEWSVGPVRDERGQVTHFVATQRDVTERRRAQEELRRSEQEFRSLFDLSAIGMTQVSPGGNYLRVNRKLCQMLGYSEQEMLQLTLHEVTHPDDRELSAVTLDSSFTGETDEYSIEKRYVRKDGSPIWVLINWRVIRDSEGQPLHTVANIQDITARKRAEEKLRANEAQLRAILDNSSSVIFVKDLEGRYLRVNRGYEVTRGVTEDEVKGKTDYDLYPREIADGVLANDREVIAANTPLQFEEQVILADGPHYFIAVKFLLYDDSGQPYAVCGIATDITERKRAEKGLRASEERLDLALRAGDIGTFDWDTRTGKVIWTEETKATFGRPSSATIGVYEDWRDRVHPEDITATEASIREAWENKLQRWQSTYRIVRADNREVRWVESMGHIFYDALGKPLRMIGTNVDVTERKQAEAEREKLLAREQAARETAEAANRSKDEFLATVSHELRSPLSAILGYARLLRYGPVDAQKVKQAVDIIERNGKAQLQLIEDLLDTARIISGKLKLEVRPVDVVAVIQEAVQMIYPAVEAKGLSLQTEIDPEVGQITGDPGRLQQVAWNLLSNAVKFTPSGGRVDVRLERVDPHVCITVSDTGKGISSDFLPFVFDRARQADISSARRHGGLGLGLSLVKYLVELHGGTVEAASAGEDQGATFKVMLPVRAISSPLSEEGDTLVTIAGLEEAATLAGMRLLVVDDENDARELLMFVLAQYGADVTAASSAAEAYAMITEAPASERPDVIVTDLGMPGEDGYSLLRRVREWERERGLYTPVVALTAYGRTEDRVRALMAGFQTHIAKPVEPAELAVVIASIVRHSKQGKHA